jgi:microcystin-dependent protein
MSDPYVGEIRMIGGDFAPNGWMFCQGQLLAIADYEVLFTLIGTTYGGDGQNTFALPDLASRLPIHQGPGYPQGSSGGAESVQLVSQNLPVHTHVAVASSGAASQTAPTNGVWAASSEQPYAVSAPNATMNVAALLPAGLSQPHDNMPPFLAINFIIALFGIFPSP